MKVPSASSPPPLPVQQHGVSGSLSHHSLIPSLASQEPENLESLINLASNVEKRLKERHKTSAFRPPSTTASQQRPHQTSQQHLLPSGSDEPMQIKRAQLTPEEKMRHHSLGLGLPTPWTHTTFSCPPLLQPSDLPPLLH
nr:uncharacterized protein LOC129164791 isoform X2 [Nothobranchius furzeri]